MFLAWKWCGRSPTPSLNSTNSAGVTERISSGFWRFGTIGLFVVFILGFLLGGFSGILFVISAAMIAVPLMYIEYHQALVTAALIGILAGFIGERGKARAFAVGSYLALHLSLYLIGLALLSSVLALGSMVPSPFFVVLGMGSLALLVFYVLREAVVYALWQWLRWRINDDVPALKVIIQRG